MQRKDKLASIFFLALLPVTTIALVWSVFGVAFNSESFGPVVFMLAAVAVGSQLRIQLPGTQLHLSVSDVVIIYSAIIFGSDLAVVLAGISATITAAKNLSSKQDDRFIVLFVNISISIITVFVTAASATVLFGVPTLLPTLLNRPDFLLLIGLLTVLPFLLNLGMASALLAIKGDKHIIEVWTLHSFDALLTYFGTALIAGLFAVATNAISVFLFGAAVGFFLILHLVNWRFVREQEKSRESAERSERERAELAERHVEELQHYVAELEKTGIALNASREKFKQAAYHDALTGLPNRTQFLELIEELLEKARGPIEFRFAVLHIDLHNFKSINDSLGHPTGDKLLVQVGERLCETVSKNGHVGRFGADEFAVLLSGISGTKGLTDFAQTIVDRIAEPYQLDERPVFTRASIGIAIGTADYETADDVLRDADMAMYYAKEKNQSIAVFADELLEKAKSDLQVETDLRYAIKRNEFEMYYQPIVDLDSLQMAGFEALVRWNHPELGFIGPDRFIPVSESTGLIVPMTLQILEAACKQLVAWQNIPGRPNKMFVSVNISGRHFEHPGLTDHIRDVILKTNIDPSCLKLEITETAVMENAESVVSMLQKIKDLGVHLSIDDFGTGYSSLSYLQKFPIDTLKIDRAFVRSMEEGRQNGEIVRAVLALAAAMDLTVVAEGIESIHQLHQLRILNCQQGQGYLFSRPVPAKEFYLLTCEPDRWQNLVAGSNFAIVPPTLVQNESFVN